MDTDSMPPTRVNTHSHNETRSRSALRLGKPGFDSESALPSSQQSMRGYSKALLFAVLFLSSGAGVALISDERLASLYGRAGTAALVALAGLLMARDGRLVHAVLRWRWMLAFVGFHALSSLWSANLYLGLQRTLVLGATVVLAANAGNLQSRSELIRTGAIWLSAFSLASFAFWSFDPVGAQFFSGGRGLLLRGIFNYNSSLGVVAGIGTILCIEQIRRDRGGPFLALLGVNVAALALSRSATSQIATIAALYLQVSSTYFLSRRVTAPVRGLRLSLVFAPIALAYFYLVPAILEVAGRDDTLSGRTVAWESLRELIFDRPTFGWGLGSTYGSIVSQIHNVDVSVFWQQNAHNGYIDMALQGGYVGVSLLAILITAFLAQRLQARNSNSIDGLAFGLFTFGAVANLANSYLFGGGLVALTFFFALAVSRAKSTEDRSGQF